jgi:hypothetical protein
MRLPLASGTPSPASPAPATCSPLDEAAVLLGALAFGQTPAYTRFRTDRQHAEHVLKQAGLVHSDAGPHHARLSKDVMFSLRYCNDEHITN